MLYQSRWESKNSSYSDWEATCKVLNQNNLPVVFAAAFTAPFSARLSLSGFSFLSTATMSEILRFEGSCPSSLCEASDQQNLGLERLGPHALHSPASIVALHSLPSACSAQCVPKVPMPRMVTPVSPKRRMCS